MWEQDTGGGRMCVCVVGGTWDYPVHKSTEPPQCVFIAIHHLLCVYCGHNLQGTRLATPSGLTLQDQITLFTSCGQNVHFVYILQMSSSTAKE